MDAVPGYIKIGIIDSKSANSELSTFGDYKYGYGYNSSGDLRNNKDWSYKMHGRPQYGTKFCASDIIIAKLDMSENVRVPMLSFKHNEKELGVAYIINKMQKYRFVVESYANGDQYELMDWNHTL